MSRWILHVYAVVLLLAALPGVAHAQLAVTRSPATGPVLDKTIRGVTVTTFSISTAGAVTRTSGDAIRLGASSVTAPSLSISCGLLNVSGLCALRYVRITISPVTGSGPAQVTRLRVGSLSGATYRTGSAPSAAGALSFDLNPLGLFGTAVFNLGMDVQLAANAASGPQTFDYIVTAEFVT